MSRYYRYDSYYEDDYQPRKSTRIYALRKAGQLDEARHLAEELIHANEADYDVFKAYAWTMIDICKRCIDDGVMASARSIADMLCGLSSRMFESEASSDEFTEILVKKINSLSRVLS